MERLWGLWVVAVVWGCYTDRTNDGETMWLCFVLVETGLLVLHVDKVYDLRVGGSDIVFKITANPNHGILIETE